MDSKLVRIRELINEKEKIDTELDLLINGTPSEPVAPKPRGRPKKEPEKPQPQPELKEEGDGAQQTTTPATTENPGE